MQTFTSDVSGQQFPEEEKVSAKWIRPSLLALIKKEHPHFNHKCHISASEMLHYRQKYYESIFSKEMSDLTEMEKQVMEKLRDHETLTDKLGEEQEDHLSYGERLADKIADFGGSWRFIIIFVGFIIVWMALNIMWLANKGFDPYPFILLNLILSCLAALQAPVIMMSQNRQEDKDRRRAKKDYMINLKSELEVRILHEKIDHLIIRQQQDTLEWQQAQMEMLNQLTNTLSQHLRHSNQKGTDKE
ncbi:DUF1003 domain-containing protein [Chitinophaga vietnamensis]|uniref:DUF1003 domain-containing protein n=1 Tax=Chitinophaga vietnamensis TaxID=2593957 RepID=UPI0011786F11|nr:DUF1003 domain-containing protein [Chitinophaga vietnamensis]